MQPQWCRLDSLKPNPRNPRRHSKAQIRQIAASIREFGFNVPILIDGDGQILAGHGRYLAAQQLGMVEVPVIQLDHLTPAQAQAFAIADNRLTENATWDDELLSAVFSDLAELDLSFSLDITGFSMAEIDIRIEGATPAASAQPDPADAVAWPDPHEIAVTRAGDLWALGRHLVLCGSSLESLSYKVLLDGAQVDMVFTDPPYNVQIDGHVSGKGRTKHREFAMAAGDLDYGQFIRFLRTYMKLVVANSKDGSLHFHCMDWRHLSEILAAGSQAYRELKNICVWVKDNGGMGSLYRSQHELVLVYKNGTAAHRNNIDLGRHGRYRTNVWSYPGANTLSRQGTEGNLLAMHPTVKPIALVADAILDCTARGDTVLDSFLGSGTTLLAAHRVGRACRGIELDPLYVDLAIQRWQAMTGEQAILTATGEPFEERARITSKVPKKSK